VIGSIFNFGLDGLMAMDVRDLYFWARCAQKERLLRFLEQIQAARIAMSTDDYYSQQVSQLLSKIREYDGGKDKVVSDNWEHLKTLRNKVGGA